MIERLKRATKRYIRAGAMAHHRRVILNAYCEGSFVAETGGDNAHNPRNGWHRAKVAAFKRGFESSNKRYRRFG